MLSCPCFPRAGAQVVVRVLEVAPGSRLPADFVKQSITKALCDLPEPLAGTDVIIEVYTGVEVSRAGRSLVLRS